MILLAAKQSCVNLLSRKPVPVIELEREPPDQTKEVESPAEPTPTIAVEFRSDENLSIDAPPEIYNPARVVSISGLEARGRVSRASEYQQPFAVIVASSFAALLPSRGTTPQEQVFTVRAYVSPRYQHLPLLGLAIGEQFYTLQLESSEGGPFTAQLYGKYDVHLQNRVMRENVSNEKLRGVWSAENNFIILRILAQPRVVR
jgi:hypothetical protein